MSARTILNPPLNTTIADLAANPPYSGGVITFDTPPTINDGTNTTISFTLPWTPNTSSSDGLTLLFNLIPFSNGSGNINPNYEIIDYVQGSPIKVDLYCFNNNISGIEITGCYWFGYIGTASTVSNTNS